MLMKTRNKQSKEYHHKQVILFYYPLTFKTCIRPRFYLIINIIRTLKHFTTNSHSVIRNQSITDS